MKEHKLTIPRTAHYFTLGEVGPHIKNYWLVCHGYGQVAHEFIQDFEPLVSAGDTLVVAPEALNKFYWGGFTGKPVASWMTKHQRLDEIADYVNYLETLHSLFLEQLPPDVRVVIFGFSQGVATVCRWMEAKRPAFQHLVMWAGMTPEDIDYQPLAPFLENKKLYAAWGDNDQFVTPERLAFQKAVFEKGGLAVEELSFVGRHEIPGEALLRLKGMIQ